MIYEGGVPAGVILSAGHQTALVSSNVNILKPVTNYITSVFPAEEGDPGRYAALVLPSLQKCRLGEDSRGR